MLTYELLIIVALVVVTIACGLVLIVGIMLWRLAGEMRLALDLRDERAASRADRPW